MPRVNKLLQSIVILLQAVLAFSQADDDSIEFHFESNEGSTIYSSTCHNFTVERQLSLVTIGALNKTEGFQQCFCSLRATYETSNVTVRVVNGDYIAKNRLEDNSTFTIKLTYSDTIFNGYLYLEEEGIGYLPADGVVITADFGFTTISADEVITSDGVLDFTCKNESYPNFSDPQLPRPPSTAAISLLTSIPERESKDQPHVQTKHSHSAIYTTIGVLVILLLSLMTVISIIGRRKLVMLQNTLNELSPSVGLETGAAIVPANITPKPGSKSETPYEDVSNTDTNDRNTSTNTANDKAKIPAMPAQNYNIKYDSLSANTNAKKELNKQVAVNSQAVSSVDVRLYEPLDIYANAETDPSDKYAQLSL